MKYEVIGDLLAPAFFDINDNGQISVASSLKLDDSFTYTVSNDST